MSHPIIADAKEEGHDQEEEEKEKEINGARLRDRARERELATHFLPSFNCQALKLARFFSFPRLARRAGLRRPGGGHIP